MRSLLTKNFKKMMADLPDQVQIAARVGFDRWRRDSASVGWKRLTGFRAELHSVEIGNRYRAVGVVDKEHNAVVWLFIGSHETYNTFLERQRQVSVQAHTSSVRERLKNRRDSQAPLTKSDTDWSP